MAAKMNNIFSLRKRGKKKILYKMNKKMIKRRLMRLSEDWLFNSVLNRTHSTMKTMASSIQK